MVLRRHWEARKSAHCVSSHWVVDSTNDTMSLPQTPLNQENPLLTSQPLLPPTKPHNNPHRDLIWELRAKFAPSPLAGSPL